MNNKGGNHYEKSEKSAVSLILVFAILLSSASHSIAISKLPLDTFEWRLQALFSDKMIQMVADAEAAGLNRVDMSTSIADIKLISDLAGNQYTLVECSPTGYMIFHNESGIFTEYSPIAPSPYLRQTGELYYLGVKGYYAEDNVSSVLNHTVLNETIEEEDLKDLREISERISDRLCEESDTAVLSRLSGEVTITPNNVTVGGVTYVNGYGFFLNMVDCGYLDLDGGICGYIAAGMLLSYQRHMTGRDFVPSLYITTHQAGVYSISTSLPYTLHNVGKSLGYGNGTTSVAIHYTVEEYLRQRGISVYHYSLYVPLANYSTVRSHIANDRPVIFLGDMINPDGGSNVGAHAVLAYGYKSLSTILC